MEDPLAFLLNNISTNSKTFHIISATIPQDHGLRTLWRTGGAWDKKREGGRGGGGERA